MALKGKRLLFVDEYLVDLNATQAAIRAGYSPKTARVQASDLLLNPDVQAAVAERKAARQSRLEVTQDEVIGIIRDVVADARREMFDSQGNKMMINHAAAIKGAELFGRHLGMFTDKLALSGQVGLQVTLEQAAVDPPAR